MPHWAKYMKIYQMVTQFESAIYIYQRKLPLYYLRDNHILIIIFYFEFQSKYKLYNEQINTICTSESKVTTL